MVNKFQNYFEDYNKIESRKKGEGMGYIRSNVPAISRLESLEELPNLSWDKILNMANHLLIVGKSDFNEVIYEFVKKEKRINKKIGQYLNIILEQTNYNKDKDGKGLFDYSLKVVDNAEDNSGKKTKRLDFYFYNKRLQAAIHINPVSK